MIFSSQEELKKIAGIIQKYARLPFVGDSIPGSVMESILSTVRSAVALNTYDFVDVYSKEQNCGWQVKATKATTPVTWKRAKIPNADFLVDESKLSEAGLQNLGNAIIDFCNQHAAESINLYGLSSIGYSRLIVHDNFRAMYFEKVLCTKQNPLVFNREDFLWRWSKPKAAGKKEQLPALHGIYKPTGEKWWAWHGLGENQLHFSGEKTWWPKQNDPHAISFSLPSPSEKMSLEDFFALLSRPVDNCSN